MKRTDRVEVATFSRRQFVKQDIASLILTMLAVACLTPSVRASEAQEIRPFRFRYFNCEFNYGGWHNFRMTDYASAHGFNIAYPYTRKVAEGRHLPAGNWTLLHGGGGGWRWWSGQPLPNEEQRAMTAMACFTGIDGFDC